VWNIEAKGMETGDVIRHAVLVIFRSIGCVQQDLLLQLKAWQDHGS